VLVATKGGHVRTPDGGWALDGRPEHLRRACEVSLKALGVEAIGLWSG
jgi:aryl-alcohol dehydrogenase-like predicted oxidoreductase